MTVTVVIFGESRSILAGVEQMLEQHGDIDVLATAVDLQEAIGLAMDLAPDVVVVGIGRACGQGMQILDAIHHAVPEVKMLALGLHKDKRLVAGLERAGAKGYVSLDRLTEDLPGMVRYLSVQGRSSADGWVGPDRRGLRREAGSKAALSSVSGGEAADQDHSLTINSEQRFT